MNPPFSHLPSLRAAFIERIPGVPVDADRETVMARLAPVFQQERTRLGFGDLVFATAEQVHGCAVAVVDRSSAFPVAGCDGLITTDPEVVLGIFVADCAAVYLAESSGRGIALVHSGKKGTELAIVPRAISQLCDLTGCTPADIDVAISPCIRPPDYEIDFAATIRSQCAAAGVARVQDEGLNTASDLSRYYSYRRELGKTGRHLALLACGR